MADPLLKEDPALPLPWVVSVPRARRPELLTTRKGADPYAKLEHWAYRNQTQIGVMEGKPPRIISFVTREKAEKFIKDYRL